jgi:Na+-transporting NADH:ubiquinone oxidoreductase subunit A
MRVNKLTFLIALTSLSLPLSAQSSTGNNNYLLISLVVVVVLLVFGLLVSLSDNLMQVEAKKNNLDTSKGQFSILPTVKNLFSPKAPKNIGDAGFHAFSKGFDLKLAGKANKVIKDGSAKTFAVQPPNFIGISPIPKVEVEVGTEVKAGDELFYDKKRPEVKYVSPVSGEVIAINRGDKRSIASIVILADKDQRYRNFELPDLNSASREDLVAFLKESGSFVFFNQRPFDIIPEDGVMPKNIFISTFDTAPLAPDNNIIVEGQADAFQKGVDVLNKLTDGKVYVGLDGRKNAEVSSVFKDVKGAELNYFRGAHPAGNVGIQIHHTAPIKGTDKVWTITVQELISLGKLFLTGHYNGERIVALTGAELKETYYARTFIGASIGELLQDNLNNDHLRIISGDPLSGKIKATDEFLNFRDDQVTVVEEGDDYELFGWLLPITPRPSKSKTFPNFLFPNHEFIADTNTHGEKRAFVVTGQYEDVLPMSIYPQHLMKAILTGDIEKMEGLGINELTEEDVAICEFVCTSKQPLQKILRDGLQIMREQG